jgi:signal transduction histidine kinase
VALYLIFTGLSVQSVVSPVTRLTSAVRKIERPEARADPLPAFGADEVGELSRVLDRWRDRVVQHEQALQREMESTRRHLGALQSIAGFASRGLDFEQMCAQGLRELLDFLGAPAGAVLLAHQGLRSVAQQGLAAERAARLLDGGMALLGAPPAVSACSAAPGEDGFWLASLAAGPDLSAACAVASSAGVEERHLQSFLHHLVMSAASRLLVEEETLRNRQRREFLHRLLSAQEEERRRIARELHDTVAQDLAAHRLQLERLASREAALPALRQAEASAHQMLQALRELLVDLRPAVLDTMGFLPALQWHLERLGREHRIRGTLSTEGGEPRLTREMSVILFRIFQEALQNVVLHSKAEHTVVTVRCTDAHLEMIIEDDGAGFDPRTVGAVRPDGHGLGLTGMIERADLLRGTCSIDSQPGSGTVVTVRVPWS